MKERTKKINKNGDPEMGDAYTFVGIERTSKLVLAHHLGRRTAEDASFFAAKLSAATEGRFQLSTDGFNAYPARSRSISGDGWTTGRSSKASDRKRRIPSAATRPPR